MTDILRRRENFRTTYEIKKKVEMKMNAWMALTKLKVGWRIALRDDKRKIQREAW